MNNVDKLKILVGRELGVSEWYNITQDMVNQFASLTGDQQWIHTDVERAKAAFPATGTIVHGYFTLSLVSKFVHGTAKLPIRADIKSIVNYGLDKVRFLSVIPVGSNVRGRVVLKSADPTDAGAKIVYAITIEVEGQEKPAAYVENIVSYILK